MTKKRITKYILVAILIVLIIASVGFYVADIVLNGTPPTKNVFKALTAVFICLGSLIRLLNKKGRKSLKYYESQYSEHIRQAFASSPFYRRKLLCAIRLYNEDNFGKALKYLVQLKPVCKEKEDLYAVGLFTGIVFTDMGFTDDAIAVYNALIDMRIASSTVYGNLGSIYSGRGDYDDAISALRSAIRCDENNPAPYNNLAKLYFDTYDFENAEWFALKALDINHKFRQSASLLAIIYSLNGDKEKARKYIHIAVSSGQDPVGLQKAIKHYQAEAIQNDDASDTDEDDQ